MHLSSILRRLGQALLLLALSACQSPSPGAGGPSGGISPLVPPLAPPGVEPVPAALTQAQETFVQGAAAFGQGSYAEAAATFLRVAESMRPVDPSISLPDGLVTNRMFAYRNAAIAFVLAGTPDEAHRALERAAAADPACEGLIREIIAILPPATGALSEPGPAEAASESAPDAGAEGAPQSAPAPSPAAPSPAARPR